MRLALFTKLSYLLAEVVPSLRTTCLAIHLLIHPLLPQLQSNRMAANTLSIPLQTLYPPVNIISFFPSQCTRSHLHPWFLNLLNVTNHPAQCFTCFFFIPKYPIMVIGPRTISSPTSPRGIVIRVIDISYQFTMGRAHPIDPCLFHIMGKGKAAIWPYPKVQLRTLKPSSTAFIVATGIVCPPT